MYYLQVPISNEAGEKFKRFQRLNNFKNQSDAMEELLKGVMVDEKIVE